MRTTRLRSAVVRGDRSPLRWVDALESRLLMSRPTGADISPVAFGGGVRALHFALDYAYEGSAVFGAMHRVGVRWWR